MRHWIFISSRFFTALESQEVLNQLQMFLKTWTSHDSPVEAEARIEYNCVLILELQAHSAQSGCSTDTLFRYIKTLEVMFNCEWLNREIVLIESGGILKLLPANKLSQSINPIAFSGCRVLDLLSYKPQTADLPWISGPESWLAKYYQN